MIFYKHRGTFLQVLHPLAGVVLMLLYGFGIIIINNPIYILLMIAWVLLLSYLDGSIKGVLGLTRYLLVAELFIIIINPILNHNGATILYSNKNIKLCITLEALVYGGVMAIKLYGTTIVLALANMVLHPDRTFSFFSRYMGKSALLMSMTLRLFPSILNSAATVIETEKIRGSSIHEKSIIKRLRNQGSVVNILFVNCLENAADMAESMYSRGYGSGKRSTYFEEKYSFVDLIIMALFIVGMLILMISQINGGNTMSYYPKLDNPLYKLSLFNNIFVLLCGMPLLINWRWKHGSGSN